MLSVTLWIELVRMSGCKTRWIEDAEQGGSLNRARECKSVFSSLMSRFIMGCFIQLGGMSIHTSMDYGLW